MKGLYLFNQQMIDITDENNSFSVVSFSVMSVMRVINVMRIMSVVGVMEGLNSLHGHPDQFRELW